ncbi:uncharacterized protein LOC143626407 [Bidens hawaiensis]|uniref:uncharacterized protein LOC143626407 n=1 Tax=Bidens hawaiensis TaxID=980011 RepID=UPI0040496134
MANNNHGPYGSKFVSVNLNKLYGQPSHHSYAPAARPRPAGGAHAGGGMVVLSRNRTLQKPTPKLSVPPPLNLPSLRKEFEKSDASGAAGGAVGGAGSGSGSRPSSSGLGWTKPASVGLRDKEVGTVGLESVQDGESGGGNVSGAYLPPSARFAHGDTGSARYSNVASVAKAMVLRGEDFPSLRAALPSSTGTVQKQKEASFQKVKHLVSEESSDDLRNSSHFNSYHHDANGGGGTGVQSLRPSSAHVDRGQKQEDPLPLIRLNPRSDWADDERDTGHGFIGRGGRDQELTKSEIYWDRDFDAPRSSVLPHKPINNERRGLPAAKSSNSEVVKTEPYREANSWRSSSIHRDKPISDRNNAHYGAVTENRDPTYVRRDAGQVRHWNQSVESPRYRNEGSKSVFSVGGRSSFSKAERGYLNDSSQKDFGSGVYDEVDPFTGNLVGVVKKKKDVINQTDFHDPVRESFEAELERVQKTQEMERQRIAEEHERAIEQARREDEERRMAILEEEERRRRLDEETREAAWIAEQERLDAIQKAEEQKLAREEEKRRMVLEEERRKQAAKQKLLELEARMAKREAEVGKTGADDEVPVGEKDSDASMDSDIDNWEANQRMVERITSAGSDSSAIDRPFDRLQFSKPVNPWKREAFEVGSNSSFLLNDQENGHPGGRSRYMPSRSHDTDGFSHLGDRDHRWNSFGDGNRDTESEYYDNVGWGQGYSRNNMQSYPERLYMNAESDKIYSFGRSPYSMKQPRVPPPPSLSVPRSSVRGENEISGPSSSLESTARTGNYDGLQDNFRQSDLADLQQGIMTQNLEKTDTLMCDSQSSLSVSSPPSSPTHLSHDELDDSGEVNDVVNDETAELTTMETLKSVSTDEDEEWSLENHDEMQEQEEYDEDDGYGEEDEVHELPDDNINLTQEFDNMQLEEKDTTNLMENTVLGSNEGVEVKLPEDEFEKDLKTDGDTNTIDMPEVSVSVVEKQAAVDAPINEQPQNVSTSSSLLGDPFSGQSTTPVKLQFGLFSGPTLIPSPVPSIQIGSIQMPLPLHPPVGSSLGHMHPSQPPPLFQFGQLRYTSPVSQGILPVPPNIHHTHNTLFNVNQNSATYLPYQFPQETSVINMKTDTGSSSSLNNQNNLSHADDNAIASKPVTKIEEKGHSTNNKDKNVPLSKAPGQSNKGRRNMYPSRNSGPRSFQPYDSTGSNERKHRRLIQRTEFRVRENVNKYETGNYTRSGYRRHVGSNMKRAAHVAEIVSESRPVKETAKTKTEVGSSTVDSKKNVPEADVDAPLQSGVVHVFKQPGIECPSDEDDFIEVRSKRQMLNDRREQREKEIKAKSRVTKQPRRASVTSSRSNKISSSSLSEPSNKARLDATKKEPSADFSTMTSESLAPIDTPTEDNSKNLQRESSSAVSDAAEDHGSNLMFETETKVVDDVQTSLGDWGNAQMDQQVIPLTQTQLDEAMKPARFNTINTAYVTSIGDHTTLVSEPVLSSSSMLTKGKAISSSSSPVNSLLAGEKIQFGAVTSPTILPPSTHVASHGIGAPGLFRPDTSQNTQNVLKRENDCVAEVEDAVSSVDVAAIKTNEIIGNGLGVVSVSGPGGLSGNQQPGSQSKPEESLSVSLPADLSVETTPISLWTPLPSPQGSSTQMLSHFPGPTPSHFPFYDMNHPMMSGPVYAFGPHDESDGPNSQAQKPTGPGSRHIGAWQNQSGMDSFYGPAGFTGPFIGPPGVQAPPHMVVYNHYAPVGQFGQVGLSFMGATYIPSGKQPDWKHDPTSSSRGEDISSINLASGPRNPPNMQPPVQHLGPGSPLLPMGPPMTMFDVPPFQTAPDDMVVQARWSHILASPLHPVPVSLPLQQQTEAITGPSQFSSHVGHPVDQSTFPPNRLSEPQPSNSSVAYPVVRDSTITHFPDEFGLVDSSGPSSSATSAPVTVSHISSGTTTNNNTSGSGVEFKNQHQPVKTSSSQHYSNNHAGGYGYQRGGLGMSPKNKPFGGQWAHCRPGFHGRYHHQQSMGTDKGFPSSTKVKQIYVAKQPGPGGSGSGSSMG